jgi:predicted dehydrogenase
MNPQLLLESHSAWSRRCFLRNSILATAAAALGQQALNAASESAPASREKLRAAIIGHTGRGNYGHELDLVFNNRDNVQVAAVADPEPSGRAKAAARCHALRQYDDYHVMLEQEKPQLVCIAPRMTDQRHAMARAALQTGAHIYTEKPFTQTLAEADDLLALADHAGLKISVAHQIRLAPSIQFLKQRLDQGLIGELVQMRAWGKQDHRAGGEDMLVLGTHTFDLMRFLAGDAQWCSAQVMQDGRQITRQDARPATESIGPVAGNQIEAHFGFANGVHATFTSRANLRSLVGPWSTELVGTKSVAHIIMDVFPTIYILKTGNWEPGGKTDYWQRLENDPALKTPPADQGFGRANQRVVDDWLEAIRANREPKCSGRAAMKALEMIMAVYQAALSGRRVTFPLTDRQHPLA